MSWKSAKMTVIPSWWCRSKAARRSRLASAWPLPAAAARLRYPHAKPYPCGPDGPLIYIKDVSFTNINKRYKYIYIFLPHLNSLRPRNIPPAAIK
ncbi:exported hypothetical protein [Klebsiella grimontii]|uniref:Uncharacterized protein n=1 Tax=Klebsiella grimontii TaxID=2058152 RepID=A0A285B4V7_9ENTR|nr:exported hypothetical protein [Klebsiella grimontii]